MTSTIHVLPTTHAGMRSYAFGLRNEELDTTMGAVADNLWSFVLKKHRKEFDAYIRAKLRNPYGEL